VHSRALQHNDALIKWMARRRIAQALRKVICQYICAHSLHDDEMAQAFMLAIALITHPTFGIITCHTRHFMGYSKISSNSSVIIFVTA
jgi:hypothetical protein